MHIPKYLVLAVVTVLCATSLHAQRADSDIQSKAREQLRQAMEQLNTGGSVAGTNAAAAPMKSMAKPAVVTAPPVTTAPVKSAPVVAPTTKDLSAAEEAKARESMRKAEKEMQARQKADEAAEAKAQKEMAAQQKAASVAAAKAEASKPKISTAVETTVAPAKVSTPVMAAPTVPAASTFAAPTTGSKDQRLLDLLQAYKADRISPTEYHAQRAKILAEP